MDTGTSNCIVKPESTVVQQYGVSLTGLPGGTSVPNVVVEFTISSTDGARLKLVGPGTDGMPAGCLAAANGANPPSSRTLNPDGSITVRCNVGSMSSNVGILQLSYQFAGDTRIPSHASVSTRAYAGGGEAGSSEAVSGPAVEVTGTAQWELEKVLYTGNGTFSTGPTADQRTIDGVVVKGYLMRYQFNITDLLAGAGGSDLVWPATFTDVMPEFPNARIDDCRATFNLWDPQGGPGTSPWTLTCPPLSEPQGADGWNLSIRPNNAAAADSGQGHMVMTVFIPLDDMNRAIDPTWQPGDDTPTGTFDFDNRAQDTDQWTINGGAPNFGPEGEPGSDGTGDNLAVRQSTASPAQWDLQKNYGGNLTFSTQIVDGVPVDGYFMDYNFRILDLAGAGNVAPWLDFPNAFKDRLVSHPGAILLSCRSLQPDPNVEATTCETGVQPADGWDISATPSRRGYQQRRMDFIARIFIPLEEMPSDPCETNITIDLRNEAVGSEDWTVDGQPNNPTGLNGAQPGFEPGWNGTTASGNNLAVNSVRPSTGQCGSLTGAKHFYKNGNNADNATTFGGDVVTSLVTLDANNNRVNVEDLRMCDVFDVSVFQLANTPSLGNSGATVDVADYVIEYAVGPNQVNTQNGPRGSNGLFPIDASSVTGAATGCRDDAGPWTTDPATTFGADWRNSVNMVRVRPVEPDHVETGPFHMDLIFNLQTRTFYNGGPNAAQAIPSGVRLTNVGAWPTGVTGATWTTSPREMIFTGMQLGVAKTVTPTTYFPGTTVEWDLGVSISRTTVGATLRNLRVEDVVPAGLHFDLACTQGLLPAGVTVNYDSQTRKATFTAGDVPITVAPLQTVFGPNANATRGRLRICTTVDTLAQPNDPFVNTMQAMADNAENAPTAQATITVVGSGQLGITKSVDKPFVTTGETYTWTVDWGNTSPEIAFEPPDIIDVLPWNGDGDPAAGSARTQYESDYTGLVRLTGPLATPTYVRGGTGIGNAVAGAWYYSTADLSTLNHDPRHASNVDPAAPGGLWRTAAEITAFGDVTAVRFVSSEPLPQASRVRSLIPMVSTSNDLDNVYVNRAMIFSATFPDQPLLSSEPYVLMPGFTLGDLVWADLNGNGRLDGAEQGVAGVTVQVRDADGDAVATRVTDAAGRWSAAALPAGTYTVHIPATMFAAGGPLEDHVVRTAGSSDALAPNEGADNNNTASPDPAESGLTSTPVTMDYTYAGDRLVGGNGPADDDVAGLAGEIIPDSFTTFTVDLAVMPAPAIDIEKATNLQDADAPTGPSITVGDLVRWTYVVTNTGGVDLTDVTVTDDLVDAADIDCEDTGSNVIPGPLAPEASITCVATGTATAGQYANTGSVTGLDPTQEGVDDDDPSHYFGIQPAVDIEKATNRQDADEPTGPLVTVGSEVEWTYVVTNTGNAPLTDVTVTDDLVDAADIDCDDTGSNIIAGPIAPAGTFTCVATGTATLGQYANLGTVTGVGPTTTDVDGNPVAGVTVDDDDPSHYLGIEPDVDIEKSTNGQDADDPTGPLVAVGGEVRWTYVVTNTGTTPLTNVTVVDDLVDEAGIDCDGTGSNVMAGPLAPDAAFTCVATGTATAGQYANLGTVTGTAPATTDVEGGTVAGAIVTDEDPSHYFGVAPAVHIEKATNGQDADEPTGPNVTLGGAVRWTFVVTNTGNAPLMDVTVTDDQVDAALIVCDDTGGNVVAGPVAPGGSFTCIAMLPSIVGQYANLGTVTGVGPATTDVDGNPVAGVTVDDDDPSHYFGIQPAVDIEKSTNGQDADVPTGPTVTVGGAVRWLYVVTNTGNAPLTNVTVTDDLVDAADIDCDDTGSNIIAGPIAPAGTFTCVATGTAVVGQYANLADVVGLAPPTTDVNGATVAGQAVEDEDPSHYFGIQPAVDIEKSTNGQDADDPTGPLVAVGGEVRWTYLVTNTGTVALTDVSVTDDLVDEADIDCDGTGSNVIAGPLAPDATFTCVATGTATAGQYANLGTVTGTAPTTTDVEGGTVTGATVTDEDPSHYFGVAPAIDIEKATNGQDADEPTGPNVAVGASVEWTYVVTNVGNVPLTNATVTDDMLDAAEIDCDGTGGNIVAGPLDPGDSFICVATGTATAGQYANLGTVTATGPGTTDVEGSAVTGAVVTDEDPSHYVGTVPRVAEPPAENPPTDGTPPVPAGGLPTTGVDVGILPAAAGLALLGGLLLVLLARRRRTRRSAE